MDFGHLSVDETTAPATSRTIEGRESFDGGVKNTVDQPEQDAIRGEDGSSTTAAEDDDNNNNSINKKREKNSAVVEEGGVGYDDEEDDLNIGTLCPADEETVAAYRLLLEHKGFILNSERDIAMLTATSRELQDFVDRADEYKDEYFDISNFVSKVGGVWQSRRPASTASTAGTLRIGSATGSTGGNISVVAAAAAAASPSSDVDGDNSPSTAAPGRSSRHRIARIFPNASSILKETQEKSATDSSALTCYDGNDPIASIGGNTCAQSHGFDGSQQRQPGMTRRMVRNAERRKIFAAAMRARAEEALFSPSVGSDGSVGGQNSELNILRAAALRSEQSSPLAKHSLRVGANTTFTSRRDEDGDEGSISFNGANSTSGVHCRGGIATTTVRLTQLSLPPLTAAMTGAGGTTPAFSLLGSSPSHAHAARAKQKQQSVSMSTNSNAKPDAMSILLRDHHHQVYSNNNSQANEGSGGGGRAERDTDDETFVADVPGGKMNGYGNLTALEALRIKTKLASTAGGVGGYSASSSPHRHHIHGGDGRSHMSSAANGFMTGINNTNATSAADDSILNPSPSAPSRSLYKQRAPEVQQVAKLLQQQARERKVEADRAKALEAFGGEEEASIAERFGTPQQQKERAAATALKGVLIGGVLITPSTNGTNRNNKQSNATVAFLPQTQPTPLGKLLAEQHSELEAQARRHSEEYIPMLEKYYEYHDAAQEKLEKIAAMADKVFGGPAAGRLGGIRDTTADEATSSHSPTSTSTLPQLATE